MILGRFDLGQRPGLGPAADLLSFVSPKESRQRKGDPAGCDPSALLRGNLVRGADGVGRRTHFAAAQLRSDNCGQLEHEARASFGARATPPAPRPRRIQKGVEVHTGHRCARPSVLGATGCDAIGWRTRRHLTRLNSTLPNLPDRPPGAGFSPRRRRAGGESQHGRRPQQRLCAQTRTAHPCTQAERSDGPYRASIPSGRAEKRRAWGGLRAAQHALSFVL